MARIRPRSADHVLGRPPSLGRSGPAAMLCCILLLFVLPGACSREGSPRPARWQDAAFQPLDRHDIRFNIQGRIYSLDSDSDFVTRYFMSRRENAFLKEQSRRIYQRHDTALKGRALVRGELHYGNFPPIETEDLCAWSDALHRDPSLLWMHQQLDMIQHLLAADFEDENAGGSIYIETLLQVLASWADESYRDPPPSTFSWNDHGTAYRLRNLLYAYDYLVHYRKDPGPVPLLLRLIHTHCLVLSDEAFYSKFTNHGFDQSYILYWAANVFEEFVESPGLSQLARERIGGEVGFMFTPEGVHVENSPSYHIWILQNVGFVDELFRAFGGGEQSGKFAGLFDDAWAYVASILKPNGRIPLVGDSIDTDYRETPLPNRSGRGVDWAKFSASGGTSGEKPPWESKIYPQSGYAVFRHGWYPPERFDQSPFLFFKAGCLAQYHRQDDDLSFVLYAFGEDWIVDSGRYSYDEKDPMRLYMRSADAHNLCIPLGDFSVSRDVETVSPGTGIIEYQEGPRNLSVTGRSTMFVGAVTERRIEYSKPYEFFITDTVAVQDGGPALEGVKLLFHTPGDKRISIRESQVLVSGKQGHSLTIELQAKPNSIRIISGQTTPEIQGWRSPVHGICEESHCIEILYGGMPGNGKVETRLTLNPSGAMDLR